jgi:hypothetical protein
MNIIINIINIIIHYIKMSFVNTAVDITPLN